MHLILLHFFFGNLKVFLGQVLDVIPPVWLFCGSALGLPPNWICLEYLCCEESIINSLQHPHQFMFLYKGVPVLLKASSGHLNYTRKGKQSHPATETVSKM